jgi:hypothetical protein
MILCGVNFALSLVLCVVFCESLFDFLSSNRPEYLHAVNGTTPSQAALEWYASNSCSTSGTRHVTLVKNLVMNEKMM